MTTTTSRDFALAKALGFVTQAEDPDSIYSAKRTTQLYAAAQAWASIAALLPETAAKQPEESNKAYHQRMFEFADSVNSKPVAGSAAVQQELVDRQKQYNAWRDARDGFAQPPTSNPEFAAPGSVAAIARAIISDCLGRVESGIRMDSLFLDSGLDRIDVIRALEKEFEVKITAPYPLLFRDLVTTIQEQRLASRRLAAFEAEVAMLEQTRAKSVSGINALAHVMAASPSANSLATAIRQFRAGYFGTLIPTIVETALADAEASLLVDNPNSQTFTNYLMARNPTLGQAVAKAKQAIEHRQSLNSGTDS